MSTILVHDKKKLEKAALKLKELKKQSRSPDHTEAVNRSEFPGLPFTPHFFI